MLAACSVRRQCGRYGITSMIVFAVALRDGALHAGVRALADASHRLACRPDW